MKASLAWRLLLVNSIFLHLLLQLLLSHSLFPQLTYTHQNLKRKLTFKKILMKLSRKFLRLGRKRRVRNANMQGRMACTMLKEDIHTYIIAHLNISKKLRLLYRSTYNIVDDHTLYSGWIVVYKVALLVS